LLVVAGLSGCGPAPSPTASASPDLYLTDAAYRRAELVSSLVNPRNGYSELRLTHYESGGAADWARLPEWNPPAVPLSLDALAGGTATRSGAARTLTIGEDARAGSDAALRALGEEAFFRYPMQLADAAAGLGSRENAELYGLWVDDSHGVGGLVQVTLPDGQTELAQTCSTCHATSRGGVLVAGASNERLDWGALVVDTTPASSGAAAPLAWGPGRLDVTTATGAEPCRIPDLRPVRWQTHLHQDATVEQRDVAMLAIRIETLMITSHNAVVRPPREIALGLALFIRSLADALPRSEPTTPAEMRGGTIFAEQCASCHAEPGLTGPPVPLDVVGTDPTLGLSLNRGTGTYRVPTLRGLGTRGPLLHDGTLAGPAALLDAARLAPDYRGGLHGPGPIVGHPFGLGLDAAEREDLLAFLGTL
jgi:mono/diheme cytochrome c family protein